MRLSCHVLLVPLFLGMIVVPGGVEASDENLVTIVGADEVKLAAKLFRTAVIKNGKQVVEPANKAVPVNFSKSNAIALGKQLGVQEVFWLSLDQMDKVRFITIAKVNVSSGKLEEANGSFTHPRELQQLVNRLANELVPKPKPTPVKKMVKPAPPRKTLEEQGYEKVYLWEGGPKFKNGDEIYIENIKGSAWWGGQDKYSLGDKIVPESGGVIDSSFPLKAWVRKGSKVEIKWMIFK